MIGAVWDRLPLTVQTLVLLLPIGGIGLFLIRGFAPWPLVRAILWRSRLMHAVFVLLIALAVGMGVAVIALERGLREGMAGAAEKFELIVAAPGSEVTAMLATVFLQPAAMPLIDGATYTEIAGHEAVTLAAPIAFGDSLNGAPIVGTTADFARYLADEQITGRLWQTEAEALIGAAMPLSLGDTFEPSHGIGANAQTGAHASSTLTVVGQMAPTGTPWDEAILVPIEAVWSIHGLANGHAPEAGDQLGPPFDMAYFPGTPAVIVHAVSLPAAYTLRGEFTRAAESMAFFPGAVLAELYRVMGDVRQAMSLMATLSQALVAISVLMGLFMLTRLFQRHVAMLRALGAPDRFVIAVIWSYTTALLSAGTALGLAFGYGAATLLSRVAALRTGASIEATLTIPDIHLALAFLAITSTLALAPATALTRQKIVPNLRP